MAGDAEMVSAQPRDGPVPAVTQAANTAGGDIVGGDKITNNYSATTDPGCLTMRRLLEAYREEKATGTQLGRYIGELEFETTNRDRVGLEAKLRNARRDELVADAKAKKELFYKHLTKYDLYESSQKIYVYLLGRVRSLFAIHVEPLVLENCPDREVIEAINREIVEVLRQELDNNDLLLFNIHLEGMVYFLTGTCRINWS